VVDDGSLATAHAYLDVRESPAAFSGQDLLTVSQQPREPAFVVQDGSGRRGVATQGRLVSTPAPGALALQAWLPGLYPEWLGDQSFLETHGTRFAYVSGAMANGIATAEMVVQMAKAGFLGFFGAAGLDFERVQRELSTIQQALGTAHSFGCNLIHSPNEPDLEARVAQLYIDQKVRRVSAAAYMQLTLPIVHYAYSGLSQNAQGQILRRNFVFAKISRPEVARRFLAPAPQEMLDALVAQGKLTALEAQLAAHLPVAEDITVESDSGGHTDNQALGALFPCITGVRDEAVHKYGFRRPIRIGAAGGLGTPTAVAAAFSMGAAYVVTGSVNQACVESGLHETGKQMLAQAGLADVIMAPAADMFELGVEVQVLMRGTMFGVRAKKLYELYRDYESLESIPAAERSRLEDQLLRQSVQDAWASTRDYWQARDPSEVERAEREPKHKMALVFRAYLGQASRWAIRGIPERRADYQIWCGPAMGAFNAWTKGTFLQGPEHRTVVQVARNLVEGAAVVSRAQQLRSYGVPVPAAAFDFRARRLD